MEPWLRKQGYENHTLDEKEWKSSQVQREKEGVVREFNSERLLSSLKEAKNAYLNGSSDVDVLSIGKRLKKLAMRS